MPTRNSSSSGSLRSELNSGSASESGVIRFGTQGGLNLFKTEKPFWKENRDEILTPDQKMQIINEERGNYTQTMKNLKEGLRHLEQVDREEGGTRRAGFLAQMERVEKETKRLFGLKNVPDAKIGVNSPEIKDAVQALFETRAGGYVATEQDWGSAKGFEATYDKRKGGFVISQIHYVDAQFDDGGEQSDPFYIVKGEGPEAYYKANQIVNLIGYFAPRKITL
jgi:hypothetical protein